MIIFSILWFNSSDYSYTDLSVCAEASVSAPSSVPAAAVPAAAAYAGYRGVACPRSDSEAVPLFHWEMFYVSCVS